MARMRKIMQERKSGTCDLKAGVFSYKASRMPGLALPFPGEMGKYAVDDDWQQGTVSGEYAGKREATISHH